MRNPVFGLFRLVTSLAGALTLAGCISVPIPQAEKDATRYYVLSTNTAGAAARSNAPAVFLRPVEVASYLSARPIIVRRGDHEIEFREFARWGESLELGIGRVLREELLAGGAASSVTVSGARRGDGVDGYQLNVRVLACEGSVEGTVIFRAIWELAVSGANENARASGEYRPLDLRWDATSEATLVAQLSQAVAGLAREISTVLAEKSK